MSPPEAGISPASLNAFMDNLYMQELQQSIAEDANPIKIEEVATCVVYHMTKEIITKYTHYL